MKLFLTVLIVLLVMCCAQEEHLAPKHGLKSKHSVLKRDLSEKDIEFVLKSITASDKEHGAVDSESIHKSIGVDREHHLYEPETKKEDDMKYFTKSHPSESEYMEEEIPLKETYELKKKLAMSETDLLALLMKIKELGATESLEDSNKKEMYGTPEEKVHLSKDPLLMKKSQKFVGDIAEDDKFSDKHVSLAESLYHMKIAGDIETYPSFKLEALTAMHDMKAGGEKLHLEKIPSDMKASSEEAYFKKVDEIGKSLLKEETYPLLKGDDIEGYLKKAVEEDKDHFYEPKIAHSEIALKSAEEKVVETWKKNHKDLFPAEGGFLLDEKLKVEGVHHREEGISHGLNDEVVKKLKASLGLDKELSKEHEELLLHLSKELHKDAGLQEGSLAYEKAKEQVHKDAHSHFSEEELKKHIDEALALGAKEKNHGSEYLFEKGMDEEKIHAINTKIGTDIEKSLHEIVGEETLKSKGSHAVGETYGFKMEKAKFGGKLPLESEIKHSISHEIPGHLAAESEKVFKGHEDEYFKKEKVFGTDAFLHKAHEDELLKKEKEYGTDAFLHKAHEDEFLKKEKVYETDGFHHKDHEDELLKKEKAFGSDAFLHKAHEDEILKKEKAYGTDAFLHKANEDELLKKEKVYETDGFLHKGHEDELLKKEKPYATEPHKVIGDELIKKEIAYGSDSLFHKNKEVLEADDHHLLHTLKGEEAGIFHGVSTDKHFVEAKDEIGAEKSHKTIHDLKTKFFELLRKVLHTRKCHLVTMRPGELLGIVNCISRSKDPILCEKFTMCEKKMPNRVIAALEKCQKETIPGEIKKCTRYAPLYPTTEIPLKIFQCVAMNIRELKPEEKKHMSDFEECARVIKAESCGRFKFFPRPH